VLIKYLSPEPVCTISTREYRHNNREKLHVQGRKYRQHHKKKIDVWREVLPEEKGETVV
jgi:hypothetical protein